MFLIIIIIGIAAYFDLKTQKIPDIILAILWAVAGIYTLISPPVFGTYIVFFFAAVYLISILQIKYYGSSILLWGDILIFPIWIAASASMIGIYGGLICSYMLAGAAITAIVKKRNVPFVPYMFLGLIICQILRMIFA